MLEQKSRSGARIAWADRDVSVAASAAAQPDTVLDRPVYPYSVVSGGVGNPAEVAAAAQRDPVVGAHYRDFRVERARVETVAKPRLVYVSYRVKDKIFYTKKKVQLRAGERVVSDGKSQIRGRCGNRISETPKGPVSSVEPPEAVMDTPQLPVLTLNGPGEIPISAASPNPETPVLAPGVEVPESIVPAAAAPLTASSSGGYLVVVPPSGGFAVPPASTTPVVVPPASTPTPTTPSVPVPTTPPTPSTPTSPTPTTPSTPSTPTTPVTPPSTPTTPTSPPTTPETPVTPPSNPPVTPPVNPPVTPPNNPPVTPPVDPPVTPPENPPIVPVCTSPPCLPPAPPPGPPPAPPPGPPPVPPPAPVPEPSTYVLIGLGLVTMGVLNRRRRRA